MTGLGLLAFQPILAALTDSAIPSGAVNTAMNTVRQFDFRKKFDLFADEAANNYVEFVCGMVLLLHNA